MHTYRYAGEIRIDLREPSDVVALPDGRFIVVCDRSNEIALVGRDGEHRMIALPEVDAAESGLEAVAYDAGKRRLFVVSEERATLLRYRLDLADAHAVFEARFKVRIGKKGEKKKANKGIEGMVFLPAAVSPTERAQLLVAKEGRPRVLALLGEDGAGDPEEIALDPEIKDVCADFSSLTVDPGSGHVIIGSDESAAAAAVALARTKRGVEARLVRALELSSKTGKSLERLEGIACAENGDLFVLLENDRVLLRYVAVG